ncbi:MAG: PD40 domain-containing protein [Flavobacteriales bacterium]|nr:PD40 domain-containing protein [Flavobacteriales bacterium]
MSLPQKCFLVLTVLAPLTGFSQMKDVDESQLNDDELLKKAVVLMIDGYLYDADKIVGDLISKDPDNNYLNYLKGFNLLYSARDHAAAIPYFEQSIPPEPGKLELLSADSKVPVDVYYHLGTSHHFLEDIDKATEYYTLFKNQSGKKSEFYDEVDLRLAQCEVAKQLIANPKSDKVELIKGNINTNLPEYSPVISANGKELYFTSRRDWSDQDLSKKLYPVDNSYPEDIYYSQLTRNDSWTDPEKLAICKPFDNEASLFMSPTMDKLFVYSDAEGNGNLFYSDFQSDEFTAIDELPFNRLNSEFWESHFVCSPDSSLIVFASDRKGGEGGRDLWLMRQEEDGSWTNPINMGPEINTPEDEDSPFLTLDGEYLYYASNGNQSMGGFDVFRTKITEKGEASAPENLGVPINSTGDDIFFTLTCDGNDAYFTSFRESGVGETDIYHVTDGESNTPAEVIALKGEVINLTEDSEKADVSFTLTNKKTNYSEELLLKNDAYFTLLDNCGEYTLTITDNVTNEVKSTEDIQTNCESVAQTFERNYLNGAYWIAGTITDAETNEPISISSVEIRNAANNELITSLEAQNGQFSTEKLTNFQPNDSVDFSIRINAEGYDSKTVEFEEVLGSIGKLTVDVSLDKSPPLIASIEDQLKEFTIYFDYDKSNIRQSEVDIMNEVVRIMNENPELKLMLYAHTDARGTKAYNKRLSNRRAQSSLKYIQKRITNPKRIQAKGLGETQLAVECDECTKQQHQLNRRTNFEIIE